MALRISTLRVTRKSLSLRLSTADATPTSRWKLLSRLLTGAPAPMVVLTVTISRNGDLVSKVYVTSTDAGYSNGSAIVVELEIGGQRIDRQYQNGMNIW